MDERDALTPEGPRMAAELARVLKATGRYHVSLLAEQSAACGWPMHRSVISGVLNGRRRLSVYVVEHLALAAGVDLAFLYPSRGCFRLLTGSAVATG